MFVVRSAHRRADHAPAVRQRGSHRHLALRLPAQLLLSDVSKYGKKRFMLASPADAHNMYPYADAHQHRRQSQVLNLAVDRLDSKLFPGAKKAVWYEAMFNAGTCSTSRRAGSTTSRRWRRAPGFQCGRASPRRPTGEGGEYSQADQRTERRVGQSTSLQRRRRASAS